MSGRPDPDLVIAAWLEEGPTSLPPITREVIVTGISLTPQQRRPVLRLPWRIPSMLFVATRLAPLALIAAIIGGLLSLPARTPSVQGDIVAPPASPVAPPTTAPAPSGSEVDLQAVAGRGWAAPARLELGPEWLAQPASNRIVDLIHTGAPPEDESQWWGASIVLVDGAQVHDPADPAWDEPIDLRPERRLPWPADLPAYLASLPGARVVDQPTAVTVGGRPGTRVVVELPPIQPLFLTKDDSQWMGGAWDVPQRMLAITVDVDGSPVLLLYSDVVDAFDARLPLVETVLGSIAWGGASSSPEPATSPHG